MRDLFSYFAIAYSIAFWALTNVIFHFDGAGRTVIMFLFIALFLNRRDVLQSFYNKSVLLYLILSVYMLFNSILKGGADVYNQDGYLMLFNAAIVPFLVLILVVVYAQKNFERTLFSCLVGVVFYAIICMLAGDVSSESRMSDSGINSNEIAIQVCMGFSLILAAYLLSFINKTTLILLAILFIICIFKTGSRTAFIMFAFITCGFVFSKFDLRNPSNILMLSLVFLIGYYGLSWILENTYVGLRLSGKEDVADGNDFEIATGTFWDNFGDRGFQYYYSWPYFLDNPITGLGLKRWCQFNIQQIVFHSEWLVQMVENGLLGLCLYLWFHSRLFIFAYFRLKKLKQSEGIGSEFRIQFLFIFTLLSLYAANFFIWTYTSSCLMAVLGLFIAKNELIESEI